MLVGRVFPDDHLHDKSDFGPGSWIDHAGLSDAGPGQIYGVSLFVAFAFITSGSSGKITPVTTSEYARTRLPPWTA